MTASAPVRVAICGFLGRMGQEINLGLSREPGVEVVGGCDPRPPTDAAPPLAVPVTTSLRMLLGVTKPDVVVDFTTAEAAAENAVVALQAGIALVVGTTGIGEATLREIDELAKKA